MHYDKIHVPEVMDINKTNDSCECIISHYIYSFTLNCRFHSKLCDGCHNF